MTIADVGAAGRATPEVPEDKPEGWALPELSAITAPCREKVEPQTCSGHPYLSLEHIESGTNRIIRYGSAADVRSTKAVFRAGDVLYGKLRPYLNKVAIPEVDGICSTDLLVFRKRGWLASGFLMRFLSLPAVVAFANHHSSGVQLPRVSWDQLGQIEVPLPPLAEQRRIVAKVEDLLAGVNATRDRLRRVPAIVKRFRQAVLAAACSGRLTADWREAAAISSASPVDGESLNGPSELPDDWGWYAAADFYKDARYGTSVKCYSSMDAGVPVLRIPNIATSRIDLTDLKYGSLSDKEFDTLRLLPGDVLVCRTNGSLDLVGKAAIVRDLPEPYAFASYLIRLRLDQEHILPGYFHIFLSSPAGRDTIEKRARTTAGQFNLNLQILSALAVPLPSVHEQHEIVRRVEALFGLADAIERRVAMATARADGLTQSILAKAFRGELVPTEAELARREGRDYEPASALLERIQRERASP